MKLPMLSADDKLAEIRALYFRTTRRSIQKDLTKALDLLKSMASEAERERATVYMEGMAQKLLPQGMRYEWSGLTLEELESGSKALILFGLGLVFV